ncbi:acyl-CoA dehydrogenase family protein [Nonomuraea sp. NPDC049152]|uniref:acyl-CoA dehydrogenase family protein n=1 Tax=Nonomuraea sp. NPDC049152 TaxID=3154350 RepID=UPI0033FDE343
MNFTFTDEQLSFGAAVREVLRDHCHPSDRGSGWKQLAELGFFAALVGEEAGGLGLSLIDVIPALEETGRAAMTGPVVETLAAAPHLPLAGRASLLVDGVALDADLAEVVVDVAGHSVASPVLEPEPGVDPGRVPFSVSAVGPGEAFAGADLLLRRVTVGVSAQLIGVARALLARSVDHAKTRTQFGRPIGAFQAVKHQLADVAIAVEFAAPLVHRAALSVDRTASLPPSRVDRDVSAAKAAAGEAAALAARTALQVHGAIGYTHELDLRFWLARTWSLTAAYGTTALHRARVTEAVFGA